MDIAVQRIRLALCCLGQGHFLFRNRVPIVSLDAPAFHSTGTPLAGPRYRASLYGGPSAELMQFVADTPFLSGTSAGYFEATETAFIPGVPGGALATLRVVAWDTTLGSSFEAVKALGLGGYGESSIFVARSATAGGGVPELPRPLLGLESFSLLPVIPEPRSIFLLLLGIPFLFLRKYQKHSS